MPSAPAADTPHRRWWVWPAQLVLASLVAWFVWRAVARDLGALRDIDLQLQFRLGHIGLAAALVWTTYAFLIVAWRTVLAGWRQSLSLPAAARIWCVSNLGRYLPGKVWSVAGLAVLAQREGVQGWAAAAAALVMQALAVGTGAAVAFVFLPQVASPVLLAIGITVAVASVLLLMAEPVTRRLSRLAGGRAQLQALPGRAVSAGAGTTLAAWLLYGLAFRTLAQGVIPGHVPPLDLAIGAFAAGYIVGLFAVFAPGGLVVREGVLLALLVPSIGTGPALALSIASRLLLTTTEAAAALAALLLRPLRGERG